MKQSRERSRLPFDKKAFERRIVDAFVKYYLNDDNTLYKFASRPDEKRKSNGKLPDFEYVDEEAETLLIELSIITSKDATRLMSLYTEFLLLKDTLDGKLDGVYYLFIAYNRIPRKKTNSLKRKNLYFTKLREDLLKKSKLLEVRKSAEIEEGVTIFKQDDNGSSLWLYDMKTSPYWTTDPKTVYECLQDAGEKFRNCNIDRSRNILLLVHWGFQALRNDITIMLNNFKVLLHDRGEFTLSIFSGDYHLYLMSFDVDWNQNVVISRIYPKPMTRGLCPLSSIFKDRTAYWHSLTKYFPG